MIYLVLLCYNTIAITHLKRPLVEQWGGGIRGKGSRIVLCKCYTISVNMDISSECKMENLCHMEAARVFFYTLESEEDW